MSTNALTQRLGIIEHHYGQFHDDLSRRLCILRTAADEGRMLAAFYRQEGSEHSRFPDLILGFAIPFQQPNHYTNALRREFQMMLEQGGEQLRQHKVDVPFRLPPSLDNSEHLFAYFQQFQQALHYLEGNLTIWLTPTQVSDWMAWEDWLLQLMDHGLPANVRLLLTPPVEADLHRLLTAHETATYEAILDLDMEGAIRQMAAGGDPQAPDVRFRKAMVEMNLAAQKGRLAKAEEHGQAALRIAEQQVGWEHLEVAVHIALGGFQPGREFQTAQNYYEKARRLAQRALDQGHSAGVEMFAQAHFALAGFLVSRQEYAPAIDCYQRIAVQCAQSPDCAFQRMEALRMMGYCYRVCRDLPASWAAYWEALQTAELLDEQTRKHTTLPYIGQGLLDIILPTNNQRYEREIRRKLETYVGPNWEQIITEHQTPTAR